MYIEPCSFIKSALNDPKNENHLYYVEPSGQINTNLHVTKTKELIIDLRNNSAEPKKKKNSTEAFCCHS